MPDNGHTSGVSVFGSDESNAGRRERRRRMRAHRRAWGDWLSQARQKLRADYWNGDKHDYLFGNRALVKRVGSRGLIFLRDRATDHVRAALVLAGLAAGRF